MGNALLVGLSRQMALGRELDVVANNLANVNTNGFKARQARFAEYLGSPAKADAFQSPDRRLGYVVDAGTPLDITTGPIERTGNPLNAAIKGDGFFAVQSAGGERYTRNGAFELDAAGQLVTSEGFAVVGDNGPITISPQETGLAIAPDGTVSTSAGARGKLKLVRFDDPSALRSEGANTFSAVGPARPAGPSVGIEPGAIEKSNVRPVVEMTRLVEINRAYANVSALMGRMDEMQRSAISRLADATAA